MGRFVYAVFALSLVLHVVVFWPAPDAPPLRKRTTPLTVRLTGGATPAMPAVRGADLEVPEGKGATAAAKARYEHSMSKADLAPVRALTQDGRERGLASSKLVGITVSSGASTVEPVLPAQAVVPDEGGADLVQIGRYRLALAVTAVRLQRASGQSVAGGLEGRALLVVYVRPGAERPEVRLAESSGVGHLDDGALNLMRRAVSQVAVPPQGQPFSVELPVLFEAM